MSNGVFLLDGRTERSDWSGTDQSGRGVLLSCQTECFDWTGERSVLIGRAPTNQDVEFLTAVKRSLPIGRGNRASSLVCVCVSVFLHAAFRLVGNRPIGTRSSSEPSKGAFRLVGMRTDGAVILVGGTESSKSSGTDQLGRGVLRSCQTERSDWSGERSVLIGRAPTNQDAEFLATVKRSVPIGRDNEALSLVGHRPIRTRSS